MKHQGLHYLLKGTIVGLLCIAGPYFLFNYIASFYYHDVGAKLFGLQQQYSFTLLVILPIVQAALVGYWATRQEGVKIKFLRTAAFILFADFILAAFLLHEGIICLIMATPLYLIVIAIGLKSGIALAKRKKQIIQISLIPVIFVAAAVDMHQPVTPHESIISDAVTINAKPDTVWRYVIHHEQNNTPPEYWLWRVGLPTPIQSTATGESVGDERQCRFTGNLAFDEKIVEAVPGKTLTFIVTQQPAYPEIMGHFALDKGQFQLVANPDGTTTVVATSWYRLFIRPVSYFDWWATDIVRNVHFRVLNHIKRLAERDAVT